MHALNSDDLPPFADASESRFALAMQGTNDGIWDWDIRSGAVFFSPRWKSMIGYEDEELPNDFSSFESRLHPEDHDRVMKAVNDHLHGLQDRYAVEFRLQHKNGTWRWMLGRGQALRDPDGLTAWPVPKQTSRNKSWPKRNSVRRGSPLRPQTVRRALFWRT
jgi:PAS domain S-box-containing protein